MLKASILGIVIFTTIVLGSIMPVLKGLVAKTMRTPHSDTHLVQTIVRWSTHHQSMHEAPLLANEFKPEPDSAASHHSSHDTTFHKAWRYVDDRFIKQYLIRKEAIEERKWQEAGLAMKVERGMQTEEMPTHYIG